MGEEPAMNILYGTYTILTSGLFMSCIGPFWIYTRLNGRFSPHLKERLGFVSPGLFQGLSGFPRIWMHAASLGEVQVAASVMKVLRGFMPGASVVLSTTTEHGHKLAQETFGQSIPVVCAPIDFVGSVRKALSRVRPDILVFLETEIWPAWLVEARRMGIKTALINGRISARSLEGYLKLRPFFREVLGHVDAFSMIMEKDAARIEAMGAHPQKIETNGNAKYDLLISRADPAIKTEMRHLLHLQIACPVFVAGSTREGEEVVVLDAYEKILKAYPAAMLVIAPRHIARVPIIRALVERCGFRYRLWSALDRANPKRTEPVVIMDTFGALFKVYSIGTLVFCGASLVPLGGQNPFEAAVWGKVVFYGPFMEDFLDAKTLLEEVGAGIEVSNADMLAEKAMWFLRHPEVLKTYGARAREAVMRNQGAAEKHARVIYRLIYRFSEMTSHKARGRNSSNAHW